jgi:hypothetical protein
MLPHFGGETLGRIWHGVHVESNAEEYLRKAEKAEASATASRDLSAKQRYKEVAQHYRVLAEQQANILTAVAVVGTGQFESKAVT